MRIESANLQQRTIFGDMVLGWPCSRARRQAPDRPVETLRQRDFCRERECLARRLGIAERVPYLAEPRREPLDAKLAVERPGEGDGKVMDGCTASGADIQDARNGGD